MPTSRATPAPAWQHLGDVLSFSAARRQALSFWSESWCAREHLLNQTIERLRSTRVATALEIDDGWHGKSDVSLQLGRWARLDVQMLVEEHARGRVLMRVARRLRLTPFFAASMVSLLALVAALGD